MQVESKKIGIDARLWLQTGIGRYIRNLVIGLGNLDKENSYVLFVRPEDQQEITGVIAGMKYGNHFSLIPCNISWHSLREQIEFPKLLNRYSFDLVHFPYFSVPVFYKKPYVVTVHDLIMNHFPSGKATTLPLPLYKLKKMGYSFVMKKTIQNAEKIIAPSHATKEEIMDHYKVTEDKIVVTPEGVDENISSLAPVIFTKEPYFLYVGNTYPHKNVERLVEAFTIFLRTHPNHRLIIAGKKDHFTRQLEKKIIDAPVEFAGFVTDETLARLYKHALATFVPSLMEGFGLTALEAMQMESLVAASKIPAMEEVCIQNALYFDPKDTLSMVKVMEDVIGMSEGEKKKRIAEAKKHVEKFSWEKMARKTLDVYNSILE
ncbi:MAG: glycosyltransferase family 4 protein [Candidatus Levyibacteriota bacterium]